MPPPSPRPVEAAEASESGKGLGGSSSSRPDHEELMRNFKSVATYFNKCADLLQNILKTNMCLENGDKKNIKDAVSDVRKAKSLVGMWLERSLVAGENDIANKLP